MFGRATIRLGIGPHSSLNQFLSPHDNAESKLYRLLFLSVTTSTKFGSRYLPRRFSERDEIWQLGRRRLAEHHHSTGELWTNGSPWCAKIVKGVKICNAFLVHRLAERDKFGMVRDLANGLCSPNLVNFSRGSRDTRRRLASVTH